MSRINTIICLRRPASIDIWRALYDILIENSLPFPAGGGDDVTEASSSLVLDFRLAQERRTGLVRRFESRLQQVNSEQPFFYDIL